MNRNKKFSRRYCLRLLTAFAFPSTVFGSSAARAEIVWQIFERRDLGFKIEMPGQPEIIVDSGEADLVLRIMTAMVDEKTTDTMFEVQYVERKKPISADEWAKIEREAAIELGGKIVRDAPFSLGDIRGRELAFAVGGNVLFNRVIVLRSSKEFRVGFGGRQSALNGPVVRRFLDSFQLLPLP